MLADLAALTPFVALLALVLWRPRWWQVRTWEGPDGCARRGRRPNVTGEDMDARTVSDREGEALPPGVCCVDCAAGACDKAEHLGLTDADVPGGGR